MGLEIFLLSDVDDELTITDRLVVVVEVVEVVVVVLVVFLGKRSCETPFINLLRLKGFFPFFFFATP